MAGTMPQRSGGPFQKTWPQMLVSVGQQKKGTEVQEDSLGPTQEGHRRPLFSTALHLMGRGGVAL